MRGCEEFHYELERTSRNSHLLLEYLFAAAELNNELTAARGPHLCHADR